MNRLCGLIIGAGLVGGLAQAGQIQIGGSNGLTATYLNATSQTSAGSGLVWTAPGGLTEGNYDTTLFKNVKLGAVAPTPYTGYSNASSGSTSHPVTDGAVTFNMIADGCGAATVTSGTCISNDMWGAPTTANGGQSTITIPVNLFGVTDVWTVITNQYGLAGAQETQVTFDFGTGPGNVTDTVALVLTNSGAYGTSTGQIRDAIDCSTIGNTVSGMNCSQYANGATAASTSVAATDNNVSISPITVLSNNIFTSAYNTGGGAGIYGNSKGNVTLTDQGFQFGNAYIGLELLDLKITELNGQSQISSTTISAVTVDTIGSSTPEPSTLLLLIGGLTVGAGVRFSKRKRA